MSHSLASSCISSLTSSWKKDSSYNEGVFQVGNCAWECATTVQLGEGAFQVGYCYGKCAVQPIANAEGPFQAGDCAGECVRAV